MALIELRGGSFAGAKIDSERRYSEQFPNALIEIDGNHTRHSILIMSIVDAPTCEVYNFQEQVAGTAFHIFSEKRNPSPQKSAIH